jgi:hypothetical protein
MKSNNFVMYNWQVMSVCILSPELFYKYWWNSWLEAFVKSWIEDNVLIHFNPNFT